MRCIILGCGTSTGVPVPGCRCAVCKSNDPKNYRDRTSVYLETDEGFSVLIDATTDLRQQAIKNNVPKVDAVLFTHSHADHILGIDDLRSFNFSTKRRIDCYGTSDTLTQITNMFGYIINQDPTYEGGMLAQLDFHEISDLEPFTVGPLTVHPCRLHHGKMLVAGFRIGKLAYATDFKFLGEKAHEVLADADYLLLDGLRYEAHRTHLTIPESIEVARSLRAKQTYLIHMTHSVEYHEVSKKLPPGINLAYDGLTLQF